MRGLSHTCPVDRLARTGAAATFAFAAAVVAVVLTTDLDHGHHPDPSARLVEAWSHTRTMTHRSVGLTERSSESGDEVLRSPVEVVQRAPDRLLRQFGEVRGRRDDRVLDCPAPLGGEEAACVVGPPGESFAEIVAREVTEFEALFAGDDPLYAVAPPAGGCWEIHRTRYDPRSGFGVEAELCFADDGTLRSIRIDHGDVVETTTYDEVTTDVRDADLEP